MSPDIAYSSHCRKWVQQQLSNLTEDAGLVVDFSTRIVADICPSGFLLECRSQRYSLQVVVQCFVSNQALFVSDSVREHTTNVSCRAADK